MNLCEVCVEQCQDREGRWVIEADAYLCTDCETDRNERLSEASLSDYYGGAWPQTDRERMAAAYDAKKAGTR